LAAVVAGMFAALVTFANVSEPVVETAPGIVTSFGPITSHNGTLRGKVLDAPGAITGSATTDRWIVQLERRSGQRVENARVDVVSSMPAVPESKAQRSATYIGDGRYEIAAVGLDQPGWWNLDLVVRYGGGVDSLAFNVIIPKRD
jgi:hypothetical protein